MGSGRSGTTTVNREQPHIFVLPEDDANRQLANGFFQQVEWNRQRWMRVLPVARVWHSVLELFVSAHVAEMDRWPLRFMVLLIDFDDDFEARLQKVKGLIPAHLTERVFVLGSLSDPEALTRAGLGSYEAIGSAMAVDCRQGTGETWGKPLLQHNAGELDRLRQQASSILF